MEVIINPNGDALDSEFDWDSSEESDWENVHTDSNEDDETDDFDVKSYESENGKNENETESDDILITTENQYKKGNKKEKNKLKKNKNVNAEQLEVKYDVNKNWKRNRKRKNKNQDRNGNFKLNARNKKFKKVKSKGNQIGKKNIRLERKKKHGQKNEKKKNQRKSKQQAKKTIVMKAKADKIHQLMESDTTLSMANLKFIGDNDEICKAIGIRLVYHFKNSKLDNIETRVNRLINDSEIDLLIRLANDKKAIDNLIKKCEKHIEKEREKKEKRNEEGNNRNKVGIDSNGMGVISQTRKGIDLRESDDSNEDNNENNENAHGMGRNGDELGNASVIGQVGGNIVHINGSGIVEDGMGFGAGFDSDLSGKRIANSGVSGNGNDNNNNNNSNLYDASIDGRIASLQKQSKEKIGQAVDNTSYINDNPSMGHH